ncbi:TPA: hypothetical protein GXZ54_03010 [bacterium]|nr:hypothetical protein [bacterium]
MKFDFYPKVILANTTATITIKSLTNEVVIDDNVDYILNFYPLERKSKFGSYNYQPDVLIKPRNGQFVFEQYFPGEQEHKIIITNPKTKEEYAFRFYSVEADLFYLNPYKGDLHMHSIRSDGKEPPEIVTAMCRKIGFDFMAITDHYQYQPSQEAIKFYHDLPIDMLITNGEEVHPKDNFTHIVNFGGNFSINEYIKNNEKIYYQEVNEIKDTIENVEDDKSCFEIASSIWVFNKIREADGLAIFCHPYWKVYQGYYISEEVTSYLLEHQPYDAYEVIGGYLPYEEESNTLQINRYYHEVAKGKQVPIVGVSDAHACYNNTFGWFYTITLAPSNSKDDIIKSIKECYSVAIENIPNEAIRPVGPFRLVKYVLYLTKEYFPLHDEICNEEGQYMLDYINGDKDAINKLKKSRGRVKRLINKIFNR